MVYKMFLACFFEGWAIIRPVGSWPASTGHGQGRSLSQSPSWQTRWRNNPLVMNVNNSIPDCLNPGLDTCSNPWPLHEHHWVEVHAVCLSFQTDDPPLWNGLLSSSARTAPLSEHRGHCLHFHEDTYSRNHCRHPSQTLGAIFNPDPRTLGNEGGVYQRWRARMVRHHREDK